MAAYHDSDTWWTLAKAGVLWLVSWFAKGYHDIAGNVLVTLSIVYLLWKWNRDIKKSKNEDRSKKI